MHEEVKRNPVPAQQFLPMSVEPDDPVSSDPVPDQSAEDSARAGADVADFELVEETSDETEPDLAGWKEALRCDVERWLGSLDEIPSSNAEDLDEAATPDLYSFFEELAALSVESRKANRRTAEAISQWSEILEHFQGDVSQLRALLAERPGQESDALPQAHCLALVELLDRAERLTQAFGRAPKRSWWGNDQKWRQAWQAQRGALDILRGHLESLLEHEGVARIKTVDTPFDPTTMIAVAGEPSALIPPGRVLEEVIPGYGRRGAVLRLAQVKVSTRLPESL